MLKELLIIGKKNLFKNKITTGLTVSSVALVMCSLILLLAINGAGNREIVKAIKEGGNLNIVHLDLRVFTEKGIRGKAKAILSPIDLRLIKNSCPYVKEISFYTVEGIDEIGIGKKMYSDIDINPEVGGSLPSIRGVPPECIKVLDINLKEGRFINNIDMLYRRRVCVLGGEVAKVITKLTGQEKLIGKKLITKNPDGKFTIIGVLHKKMPIFTALPENIAWELVEKYGENNVETGRKVHALEVNNAIYIPFTTWQDLVKGRDLFIIERGGVFLESKLIDRSLFSPYSFPPRTFIYLKIDTPVEGGEEKLIEDEETLKVFGDACTPIPENMKEPLDSIRKVLRKKYGEDTFFLFTHYGSLRDELNDQIEDSNNLLRIIFIVSLFLSSVILTSFMLLSVHKRTSEIGVCRAFGARKKDIFLQFLVEGVMIYSVGIMIGLVVGILVSYLVVKEILSWEFYIPILGIIISGLFVFLVGILSGLYPAIRAAKIQPAVAVKYE